MAPQNKLENEMMSRRRVLQFLAMGAGAAATAPFLAGCASDKPSGAASSAVTSTASKAAPKAASKATWDGNPLTLVTWGGTTQDGMKSAIADPFTAATGIATRVTSPVDYGKYTAQMQANAVTWDWVDVEGFFAVQNPTLWASLKDKVTFDAGDAIQLPGAAQTSTDWGLPAPSYAFAIAYRTDNAGPHPKTWSEFFDPKAIPGKRSIYNWPYGMLEVALLADGVAFKDLYPLNIDRALKKLDTIKKDVIFWNSGAELQQQLTTNAAPFVFAWNNRVTSLARAGQPVALEWGQNLQDSGYWVTAKNGPHVNQMMDFFSYSMTTDAQKNMAVATGYSPATKSGFAAIADDLKPWYNVAPANLSKSVGVIDLAWWAKNYDEATTKWNTWAGA